MRHTFTLARALLVAIVAWSALGAATAASRINTRRTPSEVAPIGGTMDIPVPIARSR